MRLLIPAWRGLRLAVTVNLHSKMKFVLLTTLIVISTLVFLGVTELSRASTVNLDEALDSDLGATGTYQIVPSTELGLTQNELLGIIRGVTATFTDRPIDVAVRFPGVRPECPPFDKVGDVTAAVLLDSRGEPVAFRSTPLQWAAGDLCLAGLVVPRSAIRECTKAEKHDLDCSIMINPLYRDLLRLTSSESPQYSIVVTTGRTEDESAPLRTALQQAFEGAAARATIRVDDAVMVGRKDSGGSVRAASDGIRLVYRLIAWGVLIVGGIGVLVAELIVLRDRTWFFGLARAIGARRWSVAWLVLADIVIVLAAGLTLTVVVLAGTAPWVSSFGQAAFQLELHILRPSALPGLIVGMLFVLILGGAYPAWRATRLDPLDVLERR